MRLLDLDAIKKGFGFVVLLVLGMTLYLAADSVDAYSYAELQDFHKPSRTYVASGYRAKSYQSPPIIGHYRQRQGPADSYKKSLDEDDEYEEAYEPADRCFGSYECGDDDDEYEEEDEDEYDDEDDEEYGGRTAYKPTYSSKYSLYDGEYESPRKMYEPAKRSYSNSPARYEPRPTYSKSPAPAYQYPEDAYADEEKDESLYGEAVEDGYDDDEYSGSKRYQYPRPTTYTSQSSRGRATYQRPFYQDPDDGISIENVNKNLNKNREISYNRDKLSDYNSNQQLNYKPKSKKTYHRLY